MTEQLIANLELFRMRLRVARQELNEPELTLSVKLVYLVALSGGKIEIY